jgi:hypothetical protein
MYMGHQSGVWGWGLGGSGWGGGATGTPSAVTLNVWYNICVVLNPSTSLGYWYVNGELDFTKALTTFSFSQGLTVGSGKPYSNDYNWIGEIASAAVYDTTLTAQQVKQNFNSQRSRFKV